ncbi:MAG TPA: protein-L-isoaspartate(D-aspartate) O-methyltransferase [Rhizomicrobium sp.]
MTRKEREAMVRRQIESRGVRAPLVLAAMNAVPREAFLPDDLTEFAYEDAPLPIGDEQTISQPYIVALMTEALGLEGGERVLEIGTGSGYAAAVLGEIAGEVYTVERIARLAQKASSVLEHHGYVNVRVRHGDGSLGWPEHAPYDGIVVAAGGPDVPRALKTQLAIGGRLVIPVGSDPGVQELVRITRLSDGEWRREDLADVRFVPLIGDEGWPPPFSRRRTALRRDSDSNPGKAIADASQVFDSIESSRMDALLERIGDARVVLVGEASHGTSEFYAMRNRITRALIAEKGFRIIAIEADWPDAARIDHYVRHAEYAPSEWKAFARFPTWMWRNAEVRAFVDWLATYNATLAPEDRASFHGLDLYSMYSSIRAVLDYLDEIDPDSARIARERYGCLTPWQTDPATYGRAALGGSFRSCEKDVMKMLGDLLRRQSDYALHDGERFLDAVQNARLVANAERYYRIMYYGSRASWNLRDDHMFETLEDLLAFRGTRSRAVVWAHNSHIGDAAATEMFARGEHNLGHLCRKRFGSGMYAIGFGTDHGTVAAASRWDGPPETKPVRASLAHSWERLCHETGMPRFLLDLHGEATRNALGKPRLERAIGVIYRPETERASHYFEAELPRQFDEYIWFDETRAVTPLSAEEVAGMPRTYPFGI